MTSSYFISDCPFFGWAGGDYPSHAEDPSGAKGIEAVYEWDADVNFVVSSQTDFSMSMTSGAVTS